MGPSERASEGLRPRRQTRVRVRGIRWTGGEALETRLRMGPWRVRGRIRQGSCHPRSAVRHGGGLPSLRGGGVSSSPLDTDMSPGARYRHLSQCSIPASLPVPDCGLLSPSARHMLDIWQPSHHARGSLRQASTSSRQPRTEMSTGWPVGRLADWPIPAAPHIDLQAPTSRTPLCFPDYLHILQRGQTTPQGFDEAADRASESITRVAWAASSTAAATLAHASWSASCSGSRGRSGDDPGRKGEGCRHGSPYAMKTQTGRGGRGAARWWRWRADGHGVASSAVETAVVPASICWKAATGVLRSRLA